MYICDNFFRHYLILFIFDRNISEGLCSKIRPVLCDETTPYKASAMYTAFHIVSNITTSPRCKSSSHTRQQSNDINRVWQQVLEVSPINSHTGEQRLRHWPTDSSMTWACSNQMPLQISDVEYRRAIDLLLHHDL